MKKSIKALVCALLTAGTVQADSTVLVEAENFKDLGGWGLDQQFMDVMGSPFLLAHGLGTPVSDATTTVKFEEMGSYKVWVRTRDWVGTWKKVNTPETKKAYGTPGKFQLFVNGTAQSTTFGTEGAEWHWQNGGIVEINEADTKLVLHDLTGFEGRCDAILFSKDANLIPPNSGKEMAKFRRTLLGHPEIAPDAGQYDLVVVGGGLAGSCAAIKSARLGLKVALIQDRPVVGGNNSSEVRMWALGNSRTERAEYLGDILALFRNDKKVFKGNPASSGKNYHDEQRIALIEAENNLDLYHSTRMNEVEMDGANIVAVIGQNIKTGERLRFTAKYFADCTGDGCLGVLAGADFKISVTGEGHMGRSNLWLPKDTGKPVAFPRCPWALDLSDKPFPCRDEAKKGIDPSKKLGKWYWESGFAHDPIKDGEYIRDWNFRAMYGAWDTLKNVDKFYPNHHIAWAAYISGMRESRRLLGDLILNKDDLVKPNWYQDGLVPTGWKIDLHIPNPEYAKGFEGDEFISRTTFVKCTIPYYIPYRCLYSRNINNLFMAGRDISVTREALAAVRVMKTTALMGEVVGMAAAICKNNGVNPRGVYEKHMAELKELCGIDKNDVLGGSQDVIQGVPLKAYAPGTSTRMTDANKNYKINSIPNRLKKLKSISIARGEMTVPGKGFSFNVDKSTDVFISVFNRGGYKPQGWAKTDMTLTWGDKNIDTVYMKNFAAGKVEIPEHTGVSGKTYGVPHTAFIAVGVASN